jgi:hypothetical protein
MKSKKASSNNSKTGAQGRPGAPRGAGKERATYRRPDLMGHISKEFGFCSVGEFSGFSSSSISLNGVSQIEDHLIDLSFQLVHFSRCFDSDKFCKIAVSCSVRNVPKCTDLSGQVHSHCVDIWEKLTYDREQSLLLTCCDLLPSTSDASNVGLTTHLSVNPNILGNSLHFV